MKSKENPAFRRGAESSPQEKEGARSGILAVTPKPTGLIELGRWLLEREFDFVPVSAATHESALARRSEARDLRDIFGFNLPFSPERFPLAAELLRKAEAARASGALVRSCVRFARHGRALFVYGGYPNANESARMSPDTIRFLLAARALKPTYGRVVEVESGCGAAGIWLAPHAREVVLADSSPTAIAFARVNMVLNGAGTHVFSARSDGLRQLLGSFDTILCHPRAELRTESIVESVRESLPRLAPLGRLFLMARAPVVDGVDLLKHELQAVRSSRTVVWRYQELDPDHPSPSAPAANGGLVERTPLVSLVARVR